MRFVIVFILTEHPQMRMLTLHRKKEITCDSASNNFSCPCNRKDRPGFREGSDPSIRRA